MHAERQVSASDWLTSYKEMFISASMKSALAIFRALADPTRLRIIGLVRHVELAVGELAQLLGQSQPRVSRHIKILADAGLLRRAKEGAWVFVRLGDAGSTTAVLAVLDALAVDTAADLARLADVRARLDRLRGPRLVSSTSHRAAGRLPQATGSFRRR